MTDHEAAMLVAQVSADVADAFRPRLREVERESDRLLGEMRSLRRRLAAQEGVEATLRVQLGERDRRIADLEGGVAAAAGQAQQILALEGQVQELTARLAESPRRPGRAATPAAQIELAIP